MVKQFLALSIVILIILTTMALPILTIVSAQPVPSIPNFEVTILTSGLNKPKGVISALDEGQVIQFGYDLYVAEAGANQISKVDKEGTGFTSFAETGEETFPVGVNFLGASFGDYLYVGIAGFESKGIVRVDPSGALSSFALDGKRISELDHGIGEYGDYMYAGEWPEGNIWKIDPMGNAELFSSNPETQTRYLKFSRGNGFGTLLYYTDYENGGIYRVDPEGNAEMFCSIGSPKLEGFDFGPGGAFGHYLYVGDLQEGEIYKVDPDGEWEVWASGFDGVADIHFEEREPGDFIMYIVDGQEDGAVYAIFLIEEAYPPEADADGPYEGYEGSSITFDANGSTDQDGSIVLYEWDFDNDGTYDWNGPSSTVDHTYGDDYIGLVRLRVTDDDGLTDEALADLTVKNVAPIVDVGPDQTVDEGDVVIFSGSFMDPGWLDTHTAVWDFGDGTPPVSGVVTEENNPPDSTGTVTGSHVYLDSGKYIITLEVNDDDGGIDSDMLTVTVKIPIYVDVKPGSCPNPLNMKSKGVLPVAVLGTEDFDITTIDPTTMKISRDGVEESVSPLRWSYEDVATPYQGELCGCYDLNGDGILDLVLHFNTQEVVNILGLHEYSGQTIHLTIKGNLYEDYDGIPVEGRDCTWIL